MKKWCYKCQTEQDINEFHKNKSKKDGYRTECKSCTNTANRNYAIKHDKKVKSYLSEYYQANKDKYCEIQKKRYSEKRDEIRKKQKEYYEQNKEVIRKKQKEYNREYDRTHPEQCRQRCRKRRAKRREVYESYNAIDEQYTKDLFNNRCINCGSTEELQIDHHYPLNDGNPLTINNAVLLCKTCNCSKGVKSPEDFYTPEKLTEITIILGENDK